MSELLRSEESENTRNHLHATAKDHEQGRLSRISNVAREHLRDLTARVEPAVVGVPLTVRFQAEPQPDRTGQRKGQPEKSGDERGNLHENEHMRGRQNGASDVGH